MEPYGDSMLMFSKIYNRIQHRRNPLLKAMTGLDREMIDVLQREDLSSEEKANQYDQLLQRYRKYDDKYHNRPPKRVQIVKQISEKEDEVQGIEGDVSAKASTDEVEQEILQSVPKSMEDRAKLIIQRINADNNMQWNDSGEFIYKGEKYKGTNMVDLVNDILRKRKRFNPVGWQVFTT